MHGPAIFIKRPNEMEANIIVTRRHILRPKCTRFDSSHARDLDGGAAPRSARPWLDLKGYRPIVRKESGATAGERRE